MSSVRWKRTGPVPRVLPPDLGARTHTSRLALERVLADPRYETGWDHLALIYGEMADEWDEWVATQPHYLDPVIAGLTHASPAEVAVEVACGSGQATELLRRHADAVLALDINVAMLRDAPALSGASYVVGDVRHLPVRDRSVPLLLGLNAVPYLPEFRRVIAVGGQLLWCSSFGDETPLYVAPDRLAYLLGPGWECLAGLAGHGDWALVTRLE